MVVCLICFRDRLCYCRLGDLVYRVFVFSSVILWVGLYFIEVRICNTIT